MSTDAQTQAIPRVPGPVVAVANPEVAAPGPVEVAPEESVQHMYEAGMASLNALHDRWAAAIAAVHETQVIDGPGEAAA